jgi:hypothetical protein
MINSKILKTDFAYLIFQTLLVICLLIFSNQENTHARELTAINSLPTIILQIINDDPNFDMTSIELYKYHNNVIQNTGCGIIEINGKTIQPGNIDTLTFTSEELISINTSNGSYLIQTKDNVQHSILIQKFASMSGDEVKVSNLQRVVGFRITINDDFVDQLDWSISGPVTYKKVGHTDKQIILDVTLNAYKTEDDFDQYAKPDKDGIYTTLFTITVKDKIAPYAIDNNAVFTYTEW